MRKLWFALSVCAVALACVLAFAASASARSNGATVQHFSVTYPDGSATCDGNRITQPGGKPFIKDVETCLVNGPFIAAGTYNLADPDLVFGFWCSDFDGFETCNQAIAGRLTSTDNGDGTFTWEIVAYYSQP